MWDGDPKYDRKLLFPAEVTAEEYALKATSTSSGMPETAICSYDGVEYVIAEGHSCISGVPAGSVVKRLDGTYLLILEANTENVVYYQIPEATKMPQEKF